MKKFLFAWLFVVPALIVSTTAGCSNNVPSCLVSLSDKCVGTIQVDTLSKSGDLIRFARTEFALGAMPFTLLLVDSGSTTGSEENLKFRISRVDTNSFEIDGVLVGETLEKTPLSLKLGSVIQIATKQGAYRLTLDRRSTR